MLGNVILVPLLPPEFIHALSIYQKKQGMQDHAMQKNQRVGISDIVM